MPKVNILALRQVQEAYELYEEEVEATGMTIQSKATYLLHAKQFVRWLNDDFEPGRNSRRAASR